MPNLGKIDNRRPAWLKNSLNNPAILHEIKKDLRSRSLNTVCESARCPNICECFGKKTATFMIMGDICTRNCGFCAVKSGLPKPLNPDEPRRIAEMAKKLGLMHVVVTSVTRDDLKDGGASHFAATINEIRDTRYEIRTIEVLTPDFNGNEELIKTVLNAGPNIFNHNLETVRRLTGEVRCGADYNRSLRVLKFANSCSEKIVIKSGLMVGMGERDEEIYRTLDDLADSGCDIVTIGQYLSPGRRHLSVKRYVEPETFQRYKEYGESIGIKSIFSGPLVRSSYMAEEVFKFLNPKSKANPKFKCQRISDYVK